MVSQTPLQEILKIDIRPERPSASLHAQTVPMDEKSYEPPASSSSPTPNSLRKKIRRSKVEVLPTDSISPLPMRQIRPSRRMGSHEEDSHPSKRCRVQFHPDIEDNGLWASGRPLSTRSRPRRRPTSAYSAKDIHASGDVEFFSINPSRARQRRAFNEDQYLAGGLTCCHISPDTTSPVVLPEVHHNPPLNTPWPRLVTRWLHRRTLFVAPNNNRASDISQSELGDVVNPVGVCQTHQVWEIPQERFEDIEVILESMGERKCFSKTDVDEEQGIKASV